MLEEIRACLRAWLQHRLDTKAFVWLDETCRAIAAGAPERRFFMAFSAVPRHVGGGPLALDADERAAAETARPGWRAGAWTRDQAGRTLVVLALPHDDPDAYVARLDKLFASADLGELVALYQALPLLPRAELHVKRCAEGVRTNMTSVFRAVAHQNPFPRERLDEGAWNQMVLKALFIGVRLAPIDGLDERANPALMCMLCDYAHERWAAGRPVSPELWRCVGPHADDEALRDLERVLTDGTEPERRAAALALRDCPRPEAKDVLARHPVDLPADFDWRAVE